CETAKERDKLKEVARDRLNEKYSIEIPKERKPRIKILGVDKEEGNMENDDLVKAILKQNGLEGKQESDGLKVIHKLMEQGKINLGFRRYKIMEHIAIVQCYKCWGFGHMFKDCKKEKTCRKCGKDHEEKQCTANELECINCLNRAKKYKNSSVDLRHHASDIKCPCYQKVISSEREKISYVGK
ncbi:hypothetical protein KPH14_000965, partial [Odynerus spinipes]